MAAEQEADCRYDSLGGLTLGNIAFGPGVEGSFSIPCLVVHGKYEHGQIGAFCLYNFGELDSICAGEGNVNDSQINVLVFDDLQSLFGVFGLGAHPQVRLLIYELCQSLTHDGMVIDDEDTDFALRISGSLFVCFHNI